MWFGWFGILTSMKKILIILVVLLILGAGVWYYTSRPAMPLGQSPVTQSDWQTYRNDTYGFEFQSPKDAKVGGYDPNGFVSATSQSKNLSVYYASSGISESGSIIDIDEAIVTADSPITGTEATFAGLSAIQNQNAYFIQRGSSTLRIYVRPTEDMEVTNQIISSFKFF